MLKIRIGEGETAEVVRHMAHARRLRLRCESLRGRPSEARRIEARLADIPGVESVSADSRSGRVLIRYAAAEELLERFFRHGETSSGTWLQRLRSATVSANPTSGPPPAGAWHACSVEETMTDLATSGGGLPSAEAAERLRRFGFNRADEITPRSNLSILASQLDNLPSWMLLVSSGVSALLGDRVDAASILSVLGVNAAVGFQVEQKNEQLLSSWRHLEAGEAQVIRGGELHLVAGSELVPGDVVLIREGDIVPADARVIETHRLSCNEAALTGESEPQAKQIESVDGDTILAERRSMLFAGTHVVRGHGRAIVVATGGNTEMAKVGALLGSERSPKTPLERRYGELSDRLAWAGVASGGMAGVVAMAGGRGVVTGLRDAIALAVAAIPEGLPVVATSALVRAMGRLRRRGLVVRRLASAETLGAVTVICADKTGTLTCNDMRLAVLEVDRRSWAVDEIRAQPARLFADRPTLALAAALLNSDVETLDGGSGDVVSGSSTERALILAAAAAGLDRARLRRDLPRKLLRERSGGSHYVISVHASRGDGDVVFIKGAPEQVIPMCRREGTQGLSPTRRRQLLGRNDALAAAGLRVLALAWQRRPSSVGEPPLDGYDFLGLVGLRDPLRAGAADAVKAAAGAGVRTVILTGDQRRTAQSIAQEIGLTGEILEGAVVAERLAAGDLDSVRRAVAFARVTPADKLAIVEALRGSGDVVAMVGDGINDAPALKAADIGIAVGIGASDLARQAADLVMEREDLRAILSAISEGRIVQDNLRGSLRYLLATNAAEVLLVLATAIAGRAALTPLQLLWLNLLSDTLPALALALQPGDPEVLDRPPTRPGAPLLSAADSRSILRDGIAMTLLGGAGLILGGPATAFSTLAGAELGYGFACRAAGAPPDATYRNLMLTAVGTQTAALTLPPLRRWLGLTPVAGPAEWVGFGIGLTAPWILQAASGGDVIFRQGTRGTAAAVMMAAVPPISDQEEANG